MNKSVIIKGGKKQKGFTLLETLIAIAILVLAITATFSAAQGGLSSSLESKDQVLAFYLAQEAMEMTRNIRDENSIYNKANPSSQINWLTGIAAVASDPCFPGKGCTVDATTKTFLACPTPSTCQNLRQDATTGLYGYDGSWTLTIFKRAISITNVSTNESLVTVSVSWSKGPFNRNFTIRETMLNWQ